MKLVRFYVTQPQADEAREANCGYFADLFSKNLTTAKKLNSVTFLVFKIDFSKSDESSLIYGGFVFLDVNSQKANQCLSTLILPAFLAHCPCLRAKHLTWALVQVDVFRPSFGGF